MTSHLLSNDLGPGLAYENYMKSCRPHYSSLLSALESAVAGKESAQRVVWTDDLTRSFEEAQAALKHPQSITVPRATDHLIITNDGAVRNGGVGSVLYVQRGDKMLLGGFVSVKLKEFQQKWLPCEVEALAIASAINHWSSYILQSEHPVQILSDSRPCIQAYEKLKRYLISCCAE